MAARSSIPARSRASTPSRRRRSWTPIWAGPPGRRRRSMTLGRFITLAVVLALLGLISGLAIGNHAMGVLHPEETLAFSVPQRQPLDPTRQTYLELGQF